MNALLKRNVLGLGLLVLAAVAGPAYSQTGAAPAAPATEAAPAAAAATTTTTTTATETVKTEVKKISTKEAKKACLAENKDLKGKALRECIKNKKAGK